MMVTTRIVPMSIFLLFFWAFPLFIIGQSSVQGVLKDSETNLPIEFANIYAKGTLKGTLSRQDGSFELSKLSSKDTLIISAIGYDDLTVCLPTKQMTFKLNPTVYELNEVIIPSGIPVIRVFGFKPDKIQKKRLTTLSHGLIWDGKNVSHTAAQAARYIPNPNQQTGFIQSVSFFIHKLGRPKAPFRVRIIEMKANNQPGKELIVDNLIVQAQSGDVWLEVNLADRKIEFPPNGFLVSMEWLQTKEESFWYETTYKKIMKNNLVYEAGQDKNRLRSIFWGYGQIIGLYNLNPKNNLCWRSDIQKNWYSFINRSGELMIKAKVKVWE